jgi:dolichol-phosphate mannosyltransferase
MKPEIELSVIIPFFNEADCVEAVCLEVMAVLQEHYADRWEMLIVDDGSTDASPMIMDGLAQKFSVIRAIHLHPNSGQSAALQSGFAASRGELLATLDGDGQNDPQDIRLLVEAMIRHEVDMMCGVRTRRADNWVRRISSRIANRVRAALLQDHISDVGCSIRVFRRHCLSRLCFFRNAHRFFPALVQMQGFRVAEMPVRHRPRISGESKYGGGIRSRLWVGLADLAGVFWLRRRALRYQVSEGQPHA